MAELFFCYRDGKGVRRDLDQAIAWLRKGAEAGSDIAQANLGYQYDNPINHEPRDTAKAAHWYTKAAEQGNAWAMAELFLCYRDGKGVRRDLDQAMAWLRKGAEAGSDIAQANLGYQYDNPINHEPRDTAKAARWYTKAANQGNAWAQYQLAFLYRAGEGVPWSEERAVDWFRKAADQNQARALCELSRLYASGIGEPRSPDDSVGPLLERAAGLGDSTAYYELVARYAHGIVIPQDMIRAAQWYYRAASLGVHDFVLEDPFTEQSSQPDSTPANVVGLAAPDFLPFLSQYFRAATLPDAAAPFALARACLAGRNVPKSDEDAWLWFSVAARKGSAEANAELARLPSRLPPDRLTAAAKRLPPLLEDLDNIAAAAHAPTPRRPAK